MQPPTYRELWVDIRDGLQKKGRGTDGSLTVVPGKLAIFSNEQGGRWRSRPNTILVDT